VKIGRDLAVIAEGYLWTDIEMLGGKAE